MVWSINKPEDWEPYEAEIYSLYIDKNWTLKRTMKYMEEHRGLRATRGIEFQNFCSDASLKPGSPSDVPWDAYVVFSPEGLVFSSPAASQGALAVDHAPDAASGESRAASALSETDYGDLAQVCRKYQEVLTLNLPIDRLRQVLEECGLELIQPEDQSDFWVAQSAETPIHPTITYSWSADSLGSVLSAILPHLFNGEAPALLLGGRNANTLEMTIFVITNNLIANVPSARRRQLIEWFIEPKHLRLLDSLIRREERETTQFVCSFFRMCVDQLIDEDRLLPQDVRLHEIIQTLVLSRLPDTFLSQSEASHLLNIMIMFGRLELVQFLLRRGAEFHDNHSNIHETTMMRAVRRRDRGIIRCLLDDGADPNYTWWSLVHDTRPLTALGHCLEEDSRLDDDSMEAEAISLLLMDYGADVNASAFAHGGTALEWCAFRSSRLYDIISQRRPNIDQPAVALIGRAAYDGQRTLVRSITERSWPNQEIEKALIDAVKFESVDIVEVLLEAGVDPDCSTLIGQNNRQRHNNMQEVRYERSPLCEALFRQDADAVELLLDAGATVTTEEMHILWDLLRGYYGDKRLSTSILCQLDENTTRQRELLLLAIFNGDDDLVDALLDRTGPEVHIRLRRVETIEGDFEVCTPLQAALIRRRASTVEYLWSRGCRFSRYPRHSNGSYELELACAAFSIDRGMARIIKTFLENGVSQNRPLLSHEAARGSNQAADIPKDTALHALLRSALYKSHETWSEAEVLKVCKMLVAHGAVVNQIAMSKLDCTYSKWGALVYSPLVGTPVQTACEYGLLDIVQYLISQNPGSVHSSAWHESGRTALQAACYSQTPSLELVEYLISNGVDVNEKPAETDGVTALQAAAIRGHMEIALKLLDAGANVNAPAAASDGRTAIEGAAEHGRLDMVKLLINAGATGDQTRLNRFHSAIALADEQGHYPVAALLEEHQ